MAKKGKSKKARKQADQNLRKMSAQRLVQRGEDLLSAGNYRESIKTLKIAHTKQPDHQACRMLLIRAYAGRVNQLRQKGMLQEADAIQRQMVHYQPDSAHMEASDLLLCLKSATPDNAISLYCRFLDRHPPLPEAEMVLASGLLASSAWQAAGQLPDKALLKPELSVLEQAARLMNEARWEAAWEHLQPISRRSPLAAVKLFCRAMICFNQYDDAGKQRALSMIPDSFALFPLVEQLKTAPQRNSALWDGQFITDHQVQALVSAVKQEDLAGTIRIIKRLARTLRPKDPRQAIEQLLVALWPLVPGQRLDSGELAELAERLLPGRSGRAMAAKFYFLEFSDLLTDTDAYLELLDVEFPDPADRAVAASMVLSESVDWIVRHGYLNEFLYSLPDDAVKRLGISTLNAQCALLEMILKALELDPQNRQAHDLLARLPHPSRKAKQLAEAGLIAVMDHLPDDPQPCLALARLYAEKNAFRKAEACLRKAAQRAPHDDQVRESHVLALLRAIDINFKRNKYHLIKTDLEKAEEISGRHTLAQVTARRILFDFEQTGQLSLFNGEVQSGLKGQTQTVIEQHLAGLPAVDRLTAMGILAVNSRQQPTAWNKTRSDCLERLFKRQLATVDALSSKAIRALLLPDTGRWAAPVGRRFWLDIFLTRLKSILKHLDDEDILPVLEVMFTVDRTEACLKEIQRRLKIAIEPFKTLFQFYRMVMRHISGLEQTGSDTYDRLIDQVSPQHLEMFRAAARRLAGSAGRPLKDALEHFDFGLLDEKMCNCPVCSARRALGEEAWEDEDWDEDEDDTDLFDGVGDDPIPLLIDDLERFIDSIELRGASEKVIRKRRKEVMNDYRMKSMLNALAAMLPPMMVDALSPEARYLLYG